MFLFLARIIISLRSRLDIKGAVLFLRNFFFIGKCLSTNFFKDDSKVSKSLEPLCDSTVFLSSVLKACSSSFLKSLYLRTLGEFFGTEALSAVRTSLWKSDSPVSNTPLLVYQDISETRV